MLSALTANSKEYRKLVRGKETASVEGALECGGANSETGHFIWSVFVLNGNPEEQNKTPRYYRCLLTGVNVVLK